MKVNIKSLELIEKGLTSKTVSKLTESQIDILHKKFFSEATEVITKQKTYTADEVNAMKSKGQSIPGGKAVKINPDNTLTVTMEGELDEDETDDVTDDDALGKDALQSYTGQDAPHDANDMASDGMDDDSDDNRKMMGMSEEKKKSNPWAVCTAQMGEEFGTTERSEWTKKQMQKYERCVKDVKKSLKEGKRSVSLFLESEIIKIVERNLPPKITKSDLMKYISEQGPAVSPSKPKTKPTTKPDTKPRPRPSHPGKNPNPGENPSPKAISPEKAKDEVLDVILDLLRKK